MELSNYVKAQGDFLKAKDVLDNPKAHLVIINEGSLQESKFGGERLHLQCEFNQKTFTFDCSKTNARIIAETLGSDTAKWVGKSISLDLYKTRTSEGKLVDAINVRSIVA